MYIPRPVSLDKLASHFGTVAPVVLVAANDNSPASTHVVDRAPSFALLAEVMAAMPNDDYVDRAEWTAVMHAIKGASIGTEFEGEARELALAWSAQYGASDPVKDLDMWNSIHGPRTGWGSLTSRLYRVNRPAYDVINQSLARAAFSHLNGSVADVLRPVPNWVAEKNQHHAMVKSLAGVLYFDAHSIDDAPFDVMTYTQFRAVYDNTLVDAGGKKLVGAGTGWMKHPQRRSYSAIGMWLPGKEPLGVLNLFHGLPWPKGRAPAGAGCDIVLDYFRDVVASRRPYVFEYLLNWFAWKVQNPLGKPGTNLVLFGGHGTGKSTLGKLLLSIFGRQHSLHVTSEHQILSHFNGHMEGKLAILADEAVFGKNRSQAGVYKALTSEDTMMIEHKGLKARQVANLIAFIFCSNSPTAVPVENGDRRATVLRVEKQPGVDTAYWRRLWDCWENQFGREAFMEFLLARDVSKFDPRVPLDTPEKFAMASSTADSFTLYWLELVSRHAPLVDLWDRQDVFIPSATIEGDYQEWCRRMQHRAMTNAEIQVRLDALCPEARRERPTAGKQRPRGRTFPKMERCSQLAHDALGGSAPPDPSIA